MFLTQICYDKKINLVNILHIDKSESQIWINIQLEQFGLIYDYGM